MVVGIWWCNSAELFWFNVSLLLVGVLVVYIYPVENEETDTPLLNRFIVDIEKIKHLYKVCICTLNLFCLPFGPLLARMCSRINDFEVYKMSYRFYDECSMLSIGRRHELNTFYICWQV